MKRLVALVLVVVMAFALSVTAFAKDSQTVPGDSKAAGAGVGINIFNSDDKLIARVPASSVTKVIPSRAYRLDDADEEAFLKAYDEAKNVKDKVVRAFYWLDIPEKYKEVEGFAYAKYQFSSRGKNVALTVNGKEMEVTAMGGGVYFAKLTEFGTICITSD